jgi:hypothetical protein
MRLVFIIGRLLFDSAGCALVEAEFGTGGTGAAIGFAAACRLKPATQHGLFTWSEAIFFKKHRASEL